MMPPQIPYSPQRSPVLERHRIKDGLTRAQQILHPGSHTATSQLVPPIKDISVHALWDGIVGHPVDVKINLMVGLFRD